MTKKPDPLSDFPHDAHVEKVSGGHMAYDHLVLSSPSSTIFAKVHDPAQFSDPTREQHSRLYLQKEKALLDHLNEHQFPAAPRHSELIDDHTLTMEAYQPQDGWQWRAPEDDLDTYIDANLSALQDLEAVPITEGRTDIRSTVESIRSEGWNALDDTALGKVRSKLTAWTSRLHPKAQVWCEKLSKDLESLRIQARGLTMPENVTLAHHDLRQSNVAWHPEHGVRIVDWSWAGPGRPKSDRTMFLIDLWKSGHDITKHLPEHFSPEHALELIGFWLAHSLWPTHDGTDTVRFQQVASAVSAYELREIFLKTQVN